LSVSENQASSAVVGTIKASDEDESGLLYYYIIGECCVKFPEFVHSCSQSHIKLAVECTPINVRHSQLVNKLVKRTTITTTTNNSVKTTKTSKSSCRTATICQQTCENEQCKQQQLTSYNSIYTYIIFKGGNGENVFAIGEETGVVTTKKQLVSIHQHNLCEVFVQKQ
jgi:hypothetical protein